MSLQAHNAVGWCLVVVLLSIIGFWVPGADRMIGASYLIFFFHFPSAFNCLLFFIFAGIVSLLYLLTARRSGLRFDRWAVSAVEIGVLGCTITLVTGSIWARAAWGVFWDFRDKRLLTVAIMWFTYVAYLALRSTVEDPERRARFSAVFAVIATLNVPLVHFAIKWFGKTHHPMSIGLDEASMKVAQWGGALAFFVLYTALWRLRKRLHASEESSRRLEASFSRAGI